MLLVFHLGLSYNYSKSLCTNLPTEILKQSSPKKTICTFYFSFYLERFHSRTILFQKIFQIQNYPKNFKMQQYHPIFLKKLMLSNKKLTSIIYTLTVKVEIALFYASNTITRVKIFAQNQPSTIIIFYTSEINQPLTLFYSIFGALNLLQLRFSLFKFQTRGFFLSIFNFLNTQNLPIC